MLRLHRIPLLATAALSLLVPSLAAAGALAPADVVEVGDSVSYTFRRPLVNGRGLKSLEELQGRPVFIEFWGTR